MPRKLPIIPRSELEAGIASCLVVANQRLNEARVLLASGGYSSQAAIVFSFAVEEFGKAVLLHDAYSGGQDPATINGFYDHVPKLEAAAKYIPEKRLVICRGVFQRSSVQADSFDVDEIADMGTRLSALYVDWRGGWRYGVQVDADLLLENIDAVGQIIFDTKIKWWKPDK